ncbi:MAG: glutaredoxin domain-containing protein [Candidatus Aenigmatarchaeota archaeon]
MKVKIYTTPVCPYCEITKQYLKMKNIEYEEVDVSSDIEAAREMIEKSGQMGVPVIEIDDNIIIGFNKPAIERALKNI